MSTPQQPDYQKAFTYLLTITLGAFAWFGKMTWDKLEKIDSTQQEILVKTSVYNVEIDQLKDQIKQLQKPIMSEGTFPSPAKDRHIVMAQPEAILPEDKTKKK